MEQPMLKAGASYWLSSSLDGGRQEEAQHGHVQLATPSHHAAVVIIGSPSGGPAFSTSLHLHLLWS
jgi:hypothetical protein